MKEYLKLLRINHWFKNLFVFVGFGLAALYIFHSGGSIKPTDIANIIVAFLLSSMVSSSSYIINQITDAKFDKKHPEKKHRPVPAGKVSINISLSLSIAIFLTAFAISYLFFSYEFLLTITILWIAGIVYNVEPIRLKDVPYIDVLSESVNNPIRFLLGWFVISSTLPSSILLLSTWSAGAILMTAKRYDELKHFGDTINPYRYTFKSYKISYLSKILYFYSLVTILFSGIYLYFLSTKFLIVWIAIIVFVIWVVREVLSGRAQTRSVESFVLSFKFIIIFTLFALFYFIIYYLIYLE